MEKLTKQMGNFIRIFFISPEFLLLLVAIAVGNRFGIKLVDLIPEHSLCPEKIKWVALLPVALFAYSVRSWRELLAPDHKAAGILAEWPDRNSVVLTFKIGLFYQLLFMVCAAYLWFFEALIWTRYGLPLFITSIVGSVVSATTHYFGCIRLRLLLDSVKERRA